MKKQIIIYLVIVTCISGCTASYMKDRNRDSADIFTVAFGNGYGVTARTGPVHAGLYYVGRLGSDSYMSIV